MILTAVALLLGSRMLTAAPCDENTTLIGGVNSFNVTDKKSERGTLVNGYSWEIWSDGQPQYDPGKVTFYDDDAGAAFRAEWKNPGNFLTRVGLQFEKDGKKGCNYKEYGEITAEYSYDRSKSENATSDLAGDFSYMGVYGWARKELVEFYIIDDWFGNKWQTDDDGVSNYTICDGLPSNCFVNEFTVDGSTYNVYKRTRTGVTVDGDDTTFDQYFSVRQKTRQCGTISVHEHFKKWEEAAFNMPLNEVFEAKLFMQVGGGEGYIDYYYAKIKAEKECTTGKSICTGTGDDCNSNCDCPGIQNCDTTGTKCSNLPFCTGTNGKCSTTNPECACQSTKPDCDSEGSCYKKEDSAMSWNRKVWLPMVVLWVVLFLGW